MDHFLHPELIRAIPLAGRLAIKQLSRRAQELATDVSPNPPFSIVIRTLNEAFKLEALLQDIAKQSIIPKEIIVIDNESTDHTKAIVQQYSATLITLPRKDFTYPRSMNLGMEAATTEVVFLTVAHAQLATPYTLQAGVRHFKDSPVAGAFSFPLPGLDASRTERLIGAFITPELLRPARCITRASIGTMGATGALFSRKAWQELGKFDEQYKTGGEDTALARKMLEHGYKIIKDPALAVHHTHSLGPIATTREIVHYAKTVRGPQVHQKVLARRRARLT